MATAERGMIARRDFPNEKGDAFRMKKWFAVWMLMMATVCASGLAEGYDPERVAVTKTVACLMDAPHAEGNALMHYYPGVRVEVVGEGEGDYVQVSVGAREGGLTGFIRRDELGFGEESVREVRKMDVIYNTERSFTVYSEMDTRSEVIDEVDRFVYALGVQGDWLHVGLNDWPETTGFVSIAKDGFSEPVIRYAHYIETYPLEGEVTIEEAVEYGKQRLIEDKTIANWTKDELVTREKLDTYILHMETLYYYDNNGEVNMNITFYYPELDGDGRYTKIYAFVTVDILRGEIIDYNYGNG